MWPTLVSHHKDKALIDNQDLIEHVVQHALYIRFHSTHDCYRHEEASIVTKKLMQLSPPLFQ